MPIASYALSALSESAQKNAQIAMPKQARGFKLNAGHLKYFDCMSMHVSPPKIYILCSICTYCSTHIHSH